jgi:D-methionine transport system substrate-binding protein
MSATARKVPDEPTHAARHDRRIRARRLREQAGAGDPNTLTVAATAVPHAEILDFVKPALEKQGIHLEVRVFNDYVQPNTQVAEGRIAVNYFQTEPYLAEFNKAHHTKLVTIAGVHVEPFGAYSRKWKTLAELPDGATVAIPNEPSNSGRALQLLAKAGLLTLLDPKSISATPKDIVTNPKNLKFRELEAATLPRVLGEVDLALINTNYALDAGLNPTRDALAIEGKDSPYVNFIVGPESARSDPEGAEARRRIAHAGGQGVHRAQVQGRGDPGLLIRIENEEAFVAKTLNVALRRLQGQIRLELAYSHSAAGNGEGARGAQRGRSAALLSGHAGDHPPPPRASPARAGSAFGRAHRRRFED